MPFQYTPYRNQYVGSITDLMGRGRDAEAQALIDSANAQAQAAQVSGQAWGGAVQGIGNTIAAIPGQIQAQQDRELALENREWDREQQLATTAYTDARTRDLASQDQRRIGDDARIAEQDIRLKSALRNPDGWEIQDIISVVGPERAIDIATGLAALEVEPPEPPSFDERAENLKKILQGYSRLSPAMQVEQWPATRARALSNPALDLDPANIPEVFNEAWFTQMLNYAVEPTAPVAPGSPWTGTLDGVPTVFERDPEGRMQPIGGGIGPPLSAPSSLTEDERNRAEYVALKAQGLIPEGQTFPRWLKNEQTLPGVVEPDVRSRLVTNDQGAVNIQDSMRAFNLTPTAEENKLFDRVDAYVTGPLSAPGRFLDNMFGTAPKARATRTALDLAKNSITRAMQNNLRLPEGERVAVLKSIDLETSGWRAAGVVKTKIREIDRTLRMLLQRREEIDDVASLLQAIDELGVPMGSDGFTLAEPEIVIRFDAQGNEMTK
jgi:hypothetical protein